MKIGTSFSISTVSDVRDLVPSSDPIVFVVGAFAHGQVRCGGSMQVGCLQSPCLVLNWSIRHPGMPCPELREKNRDITSPEGAARLSLAEPGSALTFVQAEIPQHFGDTSSVLALVLRLGLWLGSLQGTLG